VVIAPKLAAAPDAEAGAVAFTKIQAVIHQRCVACHAAQPTQAGFAQAPKGLMLETPDQIAAQTAKIHETVTNRYMPIGNRTQMTDAERQLVATWFAQGAKTN